jgi:sulfate adenylyltransferase subunit 1
MEILESVEIAADRNLDDFRFPVQYVNRPNLNFRGFCGNIASGIIKVGDEIKVLPSNKTSKVKTITTYEGDLPTAFVGQAVTLTLADEIDISRGDMIVKADAKVGQSNHLRAHLVWMSEAALHPGREYGFKFASKYVTGVVSNIHHRIDVNTQAHSETDSLQLNDIALVAVTLNQTVVVDPYLDNRATGAFIVIDRLTNITVGAGMITQVLEVASAAGGSSSITAFEVELNALIRKHFPHWDAKDISQLLK